MGLPQRQLYGLRALCSPPRAQAPRLLGAAVTDLTELTRHALLARFVDRPNRFVVRCELPNGAVVRAHMPNPGACGSCCTLECSSG